MSSPSLESLTKTYFSDVVRWQSWLDVEAQLALAQGELGMIPKQAAQTIASQAHMACLDRAALETEIAQTMAPVFAMTRILASACGPDGAFVHWGATTQNVIETGRLLVLRKFQSDLFSRMGQVMVRLADLATVHADLVMVGRTNRQSALPITFGFKVAGWIDEFIRVADQFQELENRFFQLRFGGAIGGYQSFGADGPELARRLAQQLNLSVSIVPNRTAVDPLIEYICKLSMLGVASGRIANELYLLMGEEFGEVSEVLDTRVVGSSTMPQKINPKYVVDLRARCSLLRSKAGVAFSLPSPSHEGDAATNRELSLLLEETCPLALLVLHQLDGLLDRLAVNDDQIRVNYLKSREMMATEALMMKLAPKLGRGLAHDLVHEAVSGANSTGASLKSQLAQQSQLAAVMSENDLDDLLSDENGIGHCRDIALAAAKAGRQKSEDMARF